MKLRFVKDPGYNLLTLDGNFLLPSDFLNGVIVESDDKEVHPDGYTICYFVTTLELARVGVFLGQTAPDPRGWSFLPRDVEIVE